MVITHGLIGSLAQRTTINEVKIEISYAPSKRFLIKPVSSVEGTRGGPVLSRINE